MVNPSHTAAEATAPDLENRTYEELALGDEASLTRTVSADDIVRFASVSGDVNPAHLDAAYAAETPFHDVIAHGMWGGALLSAVLGTRLPGPGTIYLSQSLAFHRPVRPGDVITATVRVAAKEPKGRVRLACAVADDQGREAITGEALVLAPREKVRRPAPAAPHLFVHESPRRFEPLIAEAFGQAYPGGRPSVHIIEPIPPAMAQAVERLAQVADVHVLAEGTPAKDLPPCDALLSFASADALAHRGESANANTVHHLALVDAPGAAGLFALADAVFAHADTDALRQIAHSMATLLRKLGAPEPRLSALQSPSHGARPWDEALHAEFEYEGVGLRVAGPVSLTDAVALTAVHESQDAGTAPISEPVGLIAPSRDAARFLLEGLDVLGGAVAAGVMLDAARVPVATPFAAPEAVLPSIALALLLGKP